MSIPECYYRVSAKALIFDEEWRFLLTKEENGWRDFPWWWIDHDERPKDALVREIREEMGLEVTTIENLPSYFLTAKRVSTDTYFACVFYKTIVKDYHFTPSYECLELRFFTPEDMVWEKIYFTVEQFIQEYYS